MNVGLVQLCCGRDQEKNLNRAFEIAADLVQRGAEWIVFPENTPFLGKDREKLAVAEQLDGTIVDRFSTFAADHDVALTLGSFAEIATDTHTFNTSVSFDRNGTVAAVYRKIHLFDATIDEGKSYRESDSINPGSDLVCVDIGPFTVGMSVCYDLRFPEMYRELVARGATVLIVPSAFTLETGRDHWHALLRARAIENQCYVVAPNQWGTHFENRASFGQSAVYDPWGRLIACASDGEGGILASLDPGLVSATRQRIPCLEHRVIK